MPSLRSLSALLTTAALLASQTAVDPHIHLRAQELPPLSYVCPMAADAEVLEDKPGKCRICNMDLVPVRLDTAWSCPNHAAVIREKEGTCPIDRRDLVQVVVAKHWECADKPNVFLGDPGTCGNGGARKLIVELRAHGDHNPRHGGQFFMAEDKWHHLEGTYPSAGLFRMFLYDNFTKPLAVKNAQGRVVVEEGGKETASFPLTASKAGHTLDARVKPATQPNSTAPLKLVAKVKFNEKSPEQRFDFAFTELSKEPAVAPTTTSAAPPAAKPGSTSVSPTLGSGGATKPTAAVTAKRSESTPGSSSTPAVAPTGVTAAPLAAAPATVATAVPPATTLASAGGVPNQTVIASALTRADAEQLAQNLPSSSKELLALLTQRVQEVETAVKDGQFGYIYIPSLLSKDIALALDGHTGELSDQRQTQATTAIRRLVLTAWQLDFFGDLGNKEKITDTYNTFAAAFADIKAAYGAH